MHETSDAGSAACFHDVLRAAYVDEVPRVWGNAGAGDGGAMNHGLAALHGRSYALPIHDIALHLLGTEQPGRIDPVAHQCPYGIPPCKQCLDDMAPDETGGSCYED
jgi:hypothetical protein